jgi:hypothetical protein
MIDIDEIEALAKAATPGPWQSSQYDDLEDSNGHDLLTSSGGVSCFNRAGDADFVAAANPATILALIAEVRALRNLESAVRDHRAMYEGTSDEDNMSALSIGDAISQLDAARKEQA